MAGNPYDLNRNGRWSVAERAFTHYGIGGELRRADGGGERGAGGCGSCLGGCAASLVLLAVLVLAVSACAGLWSL